MKNPHTHSFCCFFFEPPAPPHKFAFTPKTNNNHYTHTNGCVSLPAPATAGDSFSPPFSLHPFPLFNAFRLSNMSTPRPVVCVQGSVCILFNSIPPPI